MGSASVQQMADRIAALMEARLGVRGDGLAAKLRRGGRKLPAEVRAEAELLAEAAAQAGNPKLLMQLDHGRIAKAYDVCLKHLKQARRWEGRVDRLLAVTGRLVFILLAAGAVAVGLALWRGLI